MRKLVLFSPILPEIFPDQHRLSFFFSFSILFYYDTKKKIFSMIAKVIKFVCNSDELRPVLREFLKLIYVAGRKSTL